MSVEDKYAELLASQPENQNEIETLEISDPYASKTYYFVKGNKAVTAKLESGAIVTFEPTAMQASRARQSNDLSQNASFTLPDVDNILDDELANRPLNAQEPTLLTFRLYISEDLTAPAIEPVTLEVVSITQKKGSVTFNTAVPRLNKLETGQRYTTELIKPLLGFM